MNGQLELLTLPVRGTNVAGSPHPCDTSDAHRESGQSTSSAGPSATLEQTSGSRETDVAQRESSGRRPRTPEDTTRAAGSRRRLGDLRRGPQVIYGFVTDEPQTTRQIAQTAGFVRSATLEHLATLAEAGLISSPAPGRWSR